MKIIILGAGQVGATLAETLSTEDIDITVVDNNVARLRALSDRLDLRTVMGHASHPSVLDRAGAADADLLVAVTSSDEVNMVACLVAQRIFNVPTRIARVRAPDYSSHDRVLFKAGALPVDVLISPEELITGQIRRILQYPGALQVLDFAQGDMQLVAVRAIQGGPLVGKAVLSLKTHIPTCDIRVAAIFRGDRPVQPTGDTVIQLDDEVFFLAARSDIRTVIDEMRPAGAPIKRVIIAGGGNIGARLAASIEGDFKVKIVERDADRCKRLSEMLTRSIVLNGSASDRDLLVEENIEGTDVFLALTNDDVTNVMASMLARRLGVRTVITLINNPVYEDLVQDGIIDIAVSPQASTVGALLTHVRRGDMAVVYSLRRGAAEALEVVAHGDSRTSRVVGRKVGELKLPPGTTIGAVIHDGKAGVAHGDTMINEGDHVILFMTDKSQILKVEKLFHVGVGFF